MCKKLIYVMTFVLALGSTAHAALYLWNGSAGDGNWDTVLNWTVTDSLWTWPNEERASNHINRDTIGINILNGDAVSRVGGLGIEGAADGSTTAVLTLDNASSLTTTDNLGTGTDSGTKGQIDILGGSSVSVGDGKDVMIADDPDSWGTLNIVDSILDIADDLRVNRGEGYVNISGSSTINADDIVVADANTSLGYLDISGTTIVNIVDDLRIDEGEGTINISGDAVVNWGDDLYVGDNATGKGYLNISGNAVLNGGDDLKVGDDGEGHVTITDNAIVNVDDFVIVENDNGIGSLEISGNATINADDFKVVDDQGGTGSLHISGNATINCDDYYGNDDSGDLSSSTVTIDGGTVNVGDDATFADDNPGPVEVTINSGSWISGDDITVCDNLDGNATVTINGGQMICNDLKLGDSGGDDIGKIRINLNGGLFQANNLSIKITDTKIIYTGGLLRIGNLNEADMQQLITDGTIVADGVYSIATDGDYTVLNPLSPTQAKLPNPADGAEGVLLGSSLRWAAGNTAATRDVYFGTSSPPAFIGNQEAGTYYPGPIEVGTTYYWQIDEVEADGTTKHAGDVWSFTTTTDLSTVSEIATQPNPADGAGGVALDATLSWWPGASAVSHDVYLGTTSPPALLGSTTELSFDPGPLEADATYYWRVDAVAADGTTIHTGDIWSFKTVLDIPITDPSLLCWWTFDEGEGTTAIDWSGHGNYGAVNGATWVADGQVDGALDFGGDGDHVIDADASYLNGLSAITLAVWIKSDAVNTDTGFIICTDPAGDDSHDMRYDKAGATAGGTDVLKMAVTSTGGEQQIESSNGLQTTEWQHCVMVWSSGEQLKFYVNGMLDTPMANSDATTGTTDGYTKLIVGKGGKDEAASAGWDGMIDDVRIYNIALSDAEIYALGAPSEASGPSPADGATEVEKTPTLSWLPGKTAASHDVYFGDSSPPAFIGNQTEASYSPGSLDKGKTYYWRIDEVEADGTTKYEGSVWSFTVTSLGR